MNLVFVGSIYCALSCENNSKLNFRLDDKSIQIGANVIGKF